jgi:hypothetical protein
VLEFDFNREPRPFAFIDASPRRVENRGCPGRATLIAEMIDAVGRHVRQIGLRDQHLDFFVEREQPRPLEGQDRRYQVNSASDKGKTVIVQIRATHPKHPLDATAQAVEWLDRVGVHNRIDKDRISILDPAEFTRGHKALRSAGFDVSCFGSFAG